MNYPVCYFFIFLAEAVILWQYASNLFDSRHSAWKRAAVLCGLYAVLFAASLFESRWLNMVLYLLAGFIFLVTQYRLNWRPAFFHAAVLTAVMALCELMVYSIIGHFTPHFLQNRGTLRNIALFAVFSKLIFFTLIYILTHMIKRGKKQQVQQDNSVLLLVSIPVSSLFICSHL